MKKISMVLVVAAFAVTALAAKNPTAEQKACVKSAVEVKNAALKECKAKKGKERAECAKAANKSFIDAKKACSAPAPKTEAAAPATTGK